MNLHLPLTLATLALIPAVLPAQNNAALKPLFAQLNAASRNFHSAQADVRYDNYTYIVRAHDLSTGSIYIERKGSNVTMGAIIFDDGAKSPSKVLSFNGNTFEMYTPGVNQIDVFKAGANQAKYESFLTLGFGGSGTALDKAWRIKDMGTEKIDGVNTRKLELTSNDPNISNIFSHIIIWLDPARDVSLKQMFFAPNGDTRTTYYTHIKVNARVDTAPYDINKIGKKATRIQH